MRTLLASLVLFAGCAHNSSTTTEVVHTPTVSESFREVELDGAFDVEIVVGPKATVQLSGDEAAVDHVEVEVRKERLYLSMENRRPMDGKVHVTITTPALESLEINGVVDLELRGLKAGSLDMEVNGAGEVDASELVASTVDVEVSGAGKAKVNASKELDATLSGVGSIRYAGDPESVEKEVSGVGMVRPM